VILFISGLLIGFGIGGLTLFWALSSGVSSTEIMLSNHLTRERRLRNVAEQGLRKVLTGGAPTLEAQIALDELDKLQNEEDIHGNSEV
jgi:hypothetical protein